MYLYLKLPHYEVGDARTAARNLMTELYTTKPGRKEQVHASWHNAQAGLMEEPKPTIGSRVMLCTTELHWHDPDELAARFEEELARYWERQGRAVKCPWVHQASGDHAGFVILDDLIDDVINH